MTFSTSNSQKWQGGLKKYINKLNQKLVFLQVRFRPRFQITYNFLRNNKKLKIYFNCILSNFLNIK